MTEGEREHKQLAALRLVDLHTHTTASDGQLTPRQLVTAAMEIPLAAIAVTDHDTLSGLDEARAAGAEQGLEIINGLELSAEFPGGTLHILGYAFDARNERLRCRLEDFRNLRNQRNLEIIERLARLGMVLDIEEVNELAGGESVGRPHIARAMINRGMVSSPEVAFNEYLGRGSRAYVERRRCTPEEAVELIRGAGGLAAVAHPRQLRRPPDEMREVLQQLKNIGMEGLEVYHSEHSADDVMRYQQLARQLDLVATGGTDFHGHIRQGVRLGLGWGSMRISYDTVVAIRQRIARGGGG